ncbi:MAG: hypothetical protein M3450_17365 [Actinomycetota bacterium]|nr:hypothetical protein [Actinomycetota bacterium]
MRKTFALTLVAALAVACNAGGSSSPTPNPTIVPSPVLSPGPSLNPSPSPAPSAAFYLRASHTQALPPPSTFNWLPMLTISDGMVIDGNVAVPAIYPGPLLIVPFARSISEAGIADIIEEARRLGLLGDVTDFTGGSAMPGSRLGQLMLVVDSVTYDLIGNPDLVVRCDGARCDAEVGSPEAFAAFWQELSYLDGWLGGELGASDQYQPERIAVLLTAPARPEPGLEQQLARWPLDESFHEIGVAFPGLADARCTKLSGDDLDAVLPVLIGANQLTVFHDTVDTTKSALAVVVVPGADSPCPDEA